MCCQISDRLSAAVHFLSQLLYIVLTIALMSISALVPPAWGDQREPLAIRTWAGGVVSVETHWDFEVVVDLHSVSPLPAELDDADLVLTRRADNRDSLRFTLHPISKNDIAAAQEAEPPLTSEYPLAELDLYLDRLVNEAEQTLIAKDEATFVSKNAVNISQVGQRLLLIVVDGVRVAIPLVDSFGDADHELPIDVLVLGDGQDSAGQRTVDSVMAQVRQLKPRWALVTPDLAVQPDPSPTLAVGNTWCVTTDTTAADARQEDDAALQTRWVQLRTAPWQMPAELLDLFERKEQACRRSQEVFASLSVTQLNFKPSNGSHTPRWNSEHMMGRELLFFSQIYAQRSAEMQVMDLNPKQMPTDYKPRHADWDGREEARQMERVSRFSRRFAYLLDGLPLDAPAPGSAWTLSRLLQQLEKHYTTHTDNVIKKFDLTDWPKD